MTLTQIYEADPFTLSKWLTENFLVCIPNKIDTTEELQRASELMSVITNNYAYLSNIYGSLKILLRREKDIKNKAKADELVDKRELIYQTLSGLEKQRDTLSRMVTIRQMVTDELKFLGYK